MGIKEDVAEILLETNALSIDTINPYKYESGVLSPIYTDCRVLISYPKARKEITELFERIVRKQLKKEKFDAIAAAGADSIPFASYLSERLDIPMIFVREAAKKHGKQKQIEGVLEKSKNILLIKDIISTGTIVGQSIEAIRERGSDVKYCLSIFNNNLTKVNKELDDLNVENISLTDVDTLLIVSLVKRKITDDEKEEVYTWLKDPSAWVPHRKERIDKKIEENKRKVGKILLDAKAVALKPNEPFRFVSGVLSPIYTDCRILMSYPDEWREVIKALAFMIKNKVGIRNIDVIAGTAVAGIPHAAFLAEELSLPMVYVNKLEKEHGKENKVEGTIKPGDRVIVIEDLISSGGSSIKTVENLREIGAVVEDCVAIFNYDFPKSGPAFEQANVKLHSVCMLDTLVDVAVENNYIKADEKEIVMEWVVDPQAWTKERDQNEV